MSFFYLGMKATLVSPAANETEEKEQQTCRRCFSKGRLRGSGPDMTLSVGKALTADFHPPL